jgi:hypothetical protein
MSIGPVEILMVGFPENRFTGEIALELARLVEQGTIRIIDLLFVAKGDDGEVVAVELGDVDHPVREAFEPVVHEVSGLLSDEDIEDLGEDLDPGSSAALLVFEHVWATRFRDAVVASGGELLGSLRIPKEVVDEVVAARDGA